MTNLYALCLVAVAGVASHLGYFVRGEHHLQAPRTFRLYLILLGTIFLFQRPRYSTTIRDAGITTLVLATIYSVALFTSMTIYRVFFHRLHSFPGPGLAKVSKFWNVAKTIDSSNYRLLDSLHRQYGDFVRTGPNEIAIFKAEAVRAMDAPGTRCIKAPWYDILQPRVSVATTRDKGLHDKRRKLWESALTTSALQEYEGRLLHFSNQLHEYINKNLWRSIDISTVSYYYSFDVMSDLAFGESLNMLQNNKYHFALDLLQNGMDILGPLSPVEWLVRIGYSIPRVAQHFKDLIAWSGKRLEKRMQDDVQRRDIVSGLIDASRAADSLEEDRHWLAGDTFAIIIAGSDTVASTLISIFYHLVQDPSQIVKLRNELDSCSSISNIKELKSMDHLNGVINEALRLHPGLPSGGFRQTPPEGLTISGQYIPGDVTIVAPRYTIGRLESCYKRAGDFVPERWYSEPGMVVDKSGFAPFSIGRYNCVGKNIALTQLRSVVALLVSSFDVAFAQDEDGVAVWRDLKDQFNSHPGKLRLVFSPRTKTETPSP